MSQDSKRVRTRFSPSPTGSLHIGGVRTALICYAMAKRNKGDYILRIEDTDQGRFVKGAVEEIRAMLTAYGVEPTEGDLEGGNLGPYTQSKRLDLYQKYAEELISRGAAYKCFLTPEETNEIKTRNRETNTAFRSPHRDLSAAEIADLESTGKSCVVRFKVPAGVDRKIVDGVQGEVHFNTDFMDDQVLLKSDGFPTYHLAMLVDDHLMEISHVFRAFEWLPSLPLHVLLYEAMGWEMPQMFHLSAILDPEGGKLSKRKGSVSAKAFLDEGYLPEAVLNFLMLLGWSSPLPREHGEAEREIFSLQEFTDMFDVKDLNKNNPIFNREKLLWFNKQYISAMDNSLLAEKVVDWASGQPQDKTNLVFNGIAKDEHLAQKLDLVKTRASTLAEIADMLGFFYLAPSPDWSIPQLNKVQDKLDTLKSEVRVLIESLPDNAAEWKHEDWEAGMRSIAEKNEVKAGDAFMVLRVAVVGSPFSPPLFESLQVLGKEEVLSRINA